MLCAEPTLLVRSPRGEVVCVPRPGLVLVSLQGPSPATAAAAPSPRPREGNSREGRKGSAAPRGRRGPGGAHRRSVVRKGPRGPLCPTLQGGPGRGGWRKLLGPAELRARLGTWAGWAERADGRLRRRGGEALTRRERTEMEAAGAGEGRPGGGRRAGRGADGPGGGGPAGRGGKDGEEGSQRREERASVSRFPLSPEPPFALALSRGSFPLPARCLPSVPLCHSLPSPC